MSTPGRGFKPGQSGNPKGRPKGTNNLTTDLQEELALPVLVTQNGKSQTVSKQRAMVKRLTEKALSGDIRAIQLLVNMVLQRLEDGKSCDVDAPLNPDEAAMLFDHLNQIKELNRDEEAPE